MSFRFTELTRRSSRCCGGRAGAARSRKSSPSCRRRETGSRRAAPRITGQGLRGLGHEVMLIPPQYIKPYVKRGKNDAIDAEAICEAMSRPTMRFVPVKTAEQQAALTMLGVRDLLVKQRTMLINALRGHAAEFGVTAAKGPNKVVELLQRLATGEGVPALAREMLGMLASQLEAVNGKLKAIEARLMAWQRQD